MIFPLWIKIAGPALLLLVAFLGGRHTQAVVDAKEIGELEATVKSNEAVFSELRRQAEELKTQIVRSDAAAGKVTTVVLGDRLRENNSVPIGLGCEASVQFTRARLPILVAHRRLEASP
jgi:hypothetical protein